MGKKSVSIIVPVFNGLEFIDTCIDSLLKYVNCNHKVIIIDDCSTDERIEQVIREKIKNNLNYSYHRNDVNLGFVKTCNKAVFEIDRTDNDVLLLNSDTEVTEGFLEEMLDVLYLFDRHAVVAPRSNNATLHTVPFNRRLNKSETPADESYDIWKQMKVFLPRYNKVPTSVGFCLLIKREIIKNFGLFDEIYSPGYHEENDFICRINRAGYTPVQANYAYVFHKENASFSDIRNQIETKHREILEARYPEFRTKVRLYCNRYVSPVEKFAPLLFREHKPKFLYYLADLSPTHNGTSIVTIKFWEIILDKLSSDFDIYIYISKSAYLYFKDEFSGCKNFIFTDERIDPKFDLAFKPYQIFKLSDLFLMSQISLRIVYDLLDIISIRCDYLNNVHRQTAVDLAAQWSDGVIAISEYVVEDFRNFYCSSKEMEVVYPFTDTVDRSAPVNGDYVLLVGNHYRHKMIIEAIRVLKNTGHKCIVLGAQYNSYSKNRQFQFIKSGSLTEDKIKELYQYASVIIYPSHYEGFGIPVIEAGKYNKPIIVYDNPLIREVKNNFNLDNVYYYRSLDELDSIINSIPVSGNKDSGEIAVSWDDISEKLVNYLLKILNKPVDIDYLKARHKALNSYMAFSDNVNNEPVYNKRVYKVGLLMTWPYFNIIKKIIDFYTKLRTRNVNPMEL